MSSVGWLAKAHVAFWLLAVVPVEAAEFRMSGGRWDYRVSGYEEDHGNHTDLDSDLGVGTQHDGFVQLEYTHRPSWLPDIAASYGQISGAGSRTTSGGGVPLPIPLPVPLPIPGTGSSTLSATGDFDDIDATLRYAIALGPIWLSPGVTLKSVRGEVVTRDSASGETVEETYSEFFPMVHAQIAWPIGKYVRLVAHGDWISYDDDSASQYGAALELRALGPLGLYGGWQQKHYKVIGSDSALDARLTGWRYGLLVVF